MATVEREMTGVATELKSQPGLAQRVRRKLDRVYRNGRRRVFPVRRVAAAEMDRRTRLEAEIPVAEGRRLVSACPGAEPERLEHVYGEKRAYVFRNAIGWPLYGMVGDAAGNVIGETSSSDYRLRQLLKLDAFYGQRTRVEERPCAGIECSRAYANHYHWLVDALPRVWGLREGYFRRYAEIVLYVHDFEQNGMRGLLEGLLPENVVLERLPENSRVKGECCLHLPCLAEDYCGYLPGGYLERFGAVAAKMFGLSGTEPAKERIFISRRRATKRRIVNEEALARGLGRYGFETHVLEELSLAEQARLFQRAEIVVGPHGAGLTNMLFSRDCGVLELFPGRPYTHYRWLAEAKGHRYLNVCNEGDSKHGDFEVSPERVFAALEGSGWLN